MLNVAAFGWLPLAAWLGLPARVALIALVPLPIAIWRSGRIIDQAPAAFDRIAFGAVFVLTATTVAELVAFVSLRGT